MSLNLKSLSSKIHFVNLFWGGTSKLWPYNKWNILLFKIYRDLLKNYYPKLNEQFVFEI